ncbi:flagellar biosynthetic protein FliR [Limisphaera sp. VF-2]|jgi:flagellar biosynthetic protein FliR|uniref:flagellar biosynthetic protein FliR n=1 Tax=Limisphaera sp. VF-2 TaxID=3400418 RepID=UPI00177A45FF|nr:flagellar biosynthetic protein FliR [Limisphaera sp.]
MPTAIEIQAVQWMLVFLRVGAFLQVLPFFSAINFPPVMRVAMAAFIALLLGPFLPPFDPGPLTLGQWTALMARELCIGLLLGFVARMVFYAVDLAGNIIGLETGLNLGALMDPFQRQTIGAPGLVLFLLAAVVMLTLDLHHWMLAGFWRTYSVLPVGQMNLNAPLFETLVRHSALIFVVALQMAAPVIAVSAVIMLVFSLFSRAVPQMNVFAESFAFRIGGGLLVFGLTLHLTAQYVFNYLHRLPDDLLVVARLMGGV